MIPGVCSHSMLVIVVLLRSIDVTGLYTDAK